MGQIKRLKRTSITRHLSKQIIIILILFVLSHSQNFNLDLLTIGIGSWIHSPKIEDSNKHNYTKSYYNKLSASAYYKFGGIKGYIGFPLLWTIESRRNSDDIKIKDESRSAFFLSDLNFYFGKKVAFFEPRIGMKIPLGYPTDKAWLGSKNIKLQIGIGLNSNVIEDKTINISGQLMWNLFLGESFGSGKNGSWDMLPALKASYKFSDTFKIGLEILGSMQYVHWVWSRDKEFAAGIVPNVYTEIFIRSTLALTAKVGYGPSFKKTADDSDIKYKANSTNLSIGINIYP